MIAAGVVVLQAVIVLVFVFGSGSPPGPEASIEGEAPEEPSSPMEVLYDKLEEDFIANPIGTKGLRAVNAQFHLVLASQQVAADIETRKLKSLLNDQVQEALAARTVEELGPAHWASLKEDIRVRLNRILGADAVRQVLIYRVIIQ
jgi:flagellar basal body-associated protein FliL